MIKIQPERKLGLDLLRILAAFGVVFAHVSSTVTFRLPDIGYKDWIITMSLGWLRVWSVPCFIMLSGNLLLSSQKKESIWDFYKQRYKRIFFAWVFWGIFYYLIATQIVDYNLENFLYQQTHLGTYSHLYFLSVMLGLYTVTPLLKSWLNKVSLNIIVPVLICLAFVYRFGYAFWGWPQLDNLLVWFIPYLGYYLAGYWLGKLPKMKNSLMWISLAALVLFVSILITRRLVFIFETHDQDTILVSVRSLTVAFSGIVVFKFFLDIKNKYLASNTRLLKLKDLSFGVYLVHPLWLWIFNHMDWVNQLVTKSYWFWLFGVYAAVLLMSFWTAWAFKKVPGLKLLV